MYRLRLLLTAIVLMLLTLIVGLAVATYFFTAGTTEILPPVPAQTVVSDPEELVGRVALADIVTLSNQPIECVLRFAYGHLSEGTAFAADGRLRVDALDATNIVTSVTIYGDSMTVLELGGNLSTTTVDGSPLAQQMVSYMCRPWVVDRAVFELRSS